MLTEPLMKWFAGYYLWDVMEVVCTFGYLVGWVTAPLISVCIDLVFRAFMMVFKLASVSVKVYGFS